MGSATPMHTLWTPLRPSQTPTERSCRSSTLFMHHHSKDSRGGMDIACSRMHPCSSFYSSLAFISSLRRKGLKFFPGVSTSKCPVTCCPCRISFQKCKCHEYRKEPCTDTSFINTKLDFFLCLQHCFAFGHSFTSVVHLSLIHI